MMFQSIASPAKISGPKYLAELMCQKYAFDNNLGTLPKKFWQMPKYKQKYIMELSQAYNLTKKYDVRAIVNAIKSPKAKWIKSLRNKNLIPIIEDCEKNLKDTDFRQSKSSQYKSRPSFPSSKNRLSGL